MKQPKGMMKSINFIATFYLITLPQGIAFASPPTIVEGPVTKVRDGDTIEVGKIPIG
jgi:endonuclease YncB( thermonuclease family)